MHHYDPVPKVNVYLPDELAAAVKETQIPVSAVCQAALDMRTALRRVELDAWPKTSGGKGMHLAIPLAPGYDFVFAC